MKKLILVTLSLLFLLSLAGFSQETQEAEKDQIAHGPWFVDKNNDGYHDNAPDTDGDGIPNGQDKDYAGPGKGRRFAQGNSGQTGNFNCPRFGKGFAGPGKGRGFRGNGACWRNR